MLDDPPTSAELRAKYRWLAGSLLPAARVAAIEEIVFSFLGEQPRISL